MRVHVDQPRDDDAVRAIEHGIAWLGERWADGGNDRALDPHVGPGQDLVVAIDGDYRSACQHQRHLLLHRPSIAPPLDGPAFHPTVVLASLAHRTQASRHPAEGLDFWEDAMKVDRRNALKLGAGALAFGSG